MIKKKIIFGCESRGDADSPYLTRWTLLQTKWGNLNLHRFHRSDDEIMHDHPWNFWSLILWPGYWEVTPEGTQRRWPLIPAYRPAEWQHRVQLLSSTCPTCAGNGLNPFSWHEECGRCFGFGAVERPCWTLVWTGPKFRRWGFFTAQGYRDFLDWFKENRC